MAMIYVSYRSDDDPALAKMVVTRLVHRFGAANVHDAPFQQPELLPDKESLEHLMGCRILIPIIGEKWEQAGFSREEFAFAFHNKLPIIPVRFGVVALDFPIALLESQGIRRDQFDSDFADLVLKIEKALRQNAEETSIVWDDDDGVAEPGRAMASLSPHPPEHSIEALLELRRQGGAGPRHNGRIFDGNERSFSTVQRETERIRSAGPDLLQREEKIDRTAPPPAQPYAADREIMMSARHHSSLFFPKLVALLGFVGITYVFFDRVLDISRVLIDNVQHLMGMIGLSKGASIPLAGSPQDFSSKPDLVDCSVFAPPVAAGGSKFMVQVFLHLVEQAARVEFLASAMDDSSKLRGRQTLQVPIARGTVVRILLEGEGLGVEEHVQQLIWRGEPNVAAFACTVLPGNRLDALHPIVRLYVDDKPVGRILFKVKCEFDAGREGPNLLPVLSGDSARTYRFAFLSYASEDREEVLKRAQALEAAKIGFFQDVLSLTPGERYERKIYRKIDEADIFMLFWSRSARASKWVNNEIEYARDRQKANPEALPDIVPIVLEDPRDVPPPELLNDQHFNGMIATMISYESRRPKRGSGFLGRWFRVLG